MTSLNCIFSAALIVRLINLFGLHFIKLIRRRTGHFTFRQVGLGESRPHSRGLYPSSRFVSFFLCQKVRGGSSVKAGTPFGFVLVSFITFGQWAHALSREAQ